MTDPSSATPPSSIVDCEDAHKPAILAILNDAIATSTALWEYEPRSEVALDAWWKAKQAAAYPVLGLMDDLDGLVGFATYGPFRNWAAYKYTVEHSVYVATQARRRGRGKKLLAALIERATEAGYKTMIGGIAADNLASLALHEKLGFSRAGTILNAGYKFGRWLDLAFYQIALAGPENPIED